MALAVLTGFLLFLAFPPAALDAAAWVALVPLLAAVRGAHSWPRALWLSYAAGSVFFALSNFWLREVTWAGVAFAAVFYPVLWVLWGLAARALLPAEEEERNGSGFLARRWVAAAAGLAGLWAFLEFLRAEMPVFGYGMNLLGYSQAGRRPLLQLASLVGGYGVSALIVLVSVALTAMACALGAEFRKPARSRYHALRLGGALALALLGTSLVFAAVLFGHARLAERHAGRVVRVSVVQGNIPQQEKWDPAARAAILEIYDKLSRLAAYEEPDLIIWPEAAFPGSLLHELPWTRLTSLARDVRKPFLIGSPDVDPRGQAHNAAFLLGWDEAEGRVSVLDHYDKVRLVPFGEFVPLAFLFRPLGLERLAYSLGVSDFVPGREPGKLFAAPFPFSVLICFEDTFPSLARRARERGARMLVVITNDAWFGRTAAAYQHEAASIFRAVETGLPVARAANTGVSGFISPAGEVLARVSDAHGQHLFVTGGTTYPVPLAALETLYCKGGYHLPGVGALAFALALLLRVRPTAFGVFPGGEDAPTGARRLRRARPA